MDRSFGLQRARRSRTAQKRSVLLLRCLNETIWWRAFTEMFMNLWHPLGSYERNVIYESYDLNSMVRVIGLDLLMNGWCNLQMVRPASSALGLNKPDSVHPFLSKNAEIPSVNKTLCNCQHWWFARLVTAGCPEFSNPKSFEPGSLHVN